jgi:CRISPR-associated protein Cas2
MNYLICYDIRDKKRLVKVHNVVADCAMSVQLSVYYASLSEQQLTSLCEQLKHIIDKKVDDIRIYPIKSLSECENIGRSRMTMMLFDD